MKFREIYCNNCKKMLGRYNTKFYDRDKIKEILNSRGRGDQYVRVVVNIPKKLSKHQKNLLEEIQNSLD